MCSGKEIPPKTIIHCKQRNIRFIIDSDYLIGNEAKKRISKFTA